MSQYLVDFCPTGAVNSKHDNPSLPVTADEIVVDCRLMSPAAERNASALVF
jgi:uncharacterized protein (DUF849 family)